MRGPCRSRACDRRLQDGQPAPDWWMFETIQPQHSGGREGQESMGEEMGAFQETLQCRQEHERTRQGVPLKVKFCTE